MNKKIVSIVLLLLGVLVIVLGIVFATNDNKDINNDKPNQNNGSNVNQDFIFKIQNFSINKNIENEIKIAFDIINEEEEIKSKKLYINFYDNNNLLYTFDYQIDELSPYDLISVDGTINFEYTNITKYEFVFDDIKKELEPINIE